MSIKGDDQSTIDSDGARFANSFRKVAPALVFLWLVVAIIYSSGAFSRMSYVLGDHIFWLARELVQPQPATHVVIVALDDATVAAIDKPLGAAHESFAAVLNRIASTKPKAVLFDLAMPSRSFESIAPGAAARLAQSIADLNAATPAAFAVTLSDSGRVNMPETTLALAMTEDRMGVATWSLDRDQAVRRFESITDQKGNAVPLLLDSLAQQLRLQRPSGPINFHMTGRWPTLSMSRLLAADNSRISDVDMFQLLSKKVVIVGSVLPFDDRYKQPIAVPTTFDQPHNVDQNKYANVSVLAPGSLLYAQWFEAALSSKQLRYSKLFNWITALALALVVSMLTLRKTRAGVAFSVVLTIALPFYASLLITQQILIDIVPALLLVIASIAFVVGVKAWKDFDERRSLRQAFAGYVSPALLEAIVSHEIDPREPIRTHVASMFIDLRDSSTLTAQLQPERMVVLLDQFFDVVVRSLHQHDGVVDNFRGDGAMAFIGAPRSVRSPLSQSLAAVDALYTELLELNMRLQQQELPAVRAAIGLCFGEVITVNVGSKARNNYTAIGNSVNEAARLQEVAKAQQGDLRGTVLSVALSDSAYNALSLELSASELAAQRSVIFSRIQQVATLELRGVGQHVVYLYSPRVEGITHAH
jgi:adenylate cyclase